MSTVIILNLIASTNDCFLNQALQIRCYERTIIHRRLNTTRLHWTKKLLTDIYRCEWKIDFNRKVNIMGSLSHEIFVKNNDNFYDKYGSRKKNSNQINYSY